MDNNILKHQLLKTLKADCIMGGAGNWISALALADKIGIMSDVAGKKRKIRELVEELRNETDPDKSRIASGDLGYCWAGNDYHLMAISMERNLANARGQFRSQYNALKTFPEFDIKNLNYNLFEEVKNGI